MNLVKLAVGIKSVNELKTRQALKYKKHNKNLHITRLFPKKFELIKNEGSMFWIINGYISVRQKIVGLEKVKHENGKNYCHILLDKDLIETRNIRHRAFQGWRYLKPENSPKDLLRDESIINNELRKILEDLYLI